MRHVIGFVNQIPLLSSTGSGRILRSLLSEVPKDTGYVCVMAAHDNAQKCPPAPAYNEHFLPVRPHLGRIESTRFGKYCDLIEPFSAGTFTERLEAVMREHQVTAIHAIPHGMHFAYASRVARRMGVPFYLNVHDELAYNLHGNPRLAEAERELEQAWLSATGRIVISDQMGEEYCRRFGQREYVMVTDGLEEPPTTKRAPVKDRLYVYFMGSQHLSYEPNFRVLLAALEKIKAATGMDVKLISRGGLQPSLRVHPLVETRPSRPEKEIEGDFEEADVLYLPLPTQPENAPFYRYSLSTKMVTYLGIGAPILYHGTADAAAAVVLGDAAFHCHDMNADSLASALMDTLEPRKREAVIENAFALAHRRFMAGDNRAAFWDLVRGGTASRIHAHV